MSEFPSDESRLEHIRALQAEARGYEVRQTGAREDGDTVLVKKMTNRLAKVQTEISRLTGGDEPTATEGRGKRGARRNQAAPVAAPDAQRDDDSDPDTAVSNDGGVDGDEDDPSV